MCEMPGNKAALRRHFRELRSNIPCRAEKSQQIQEHLLTYSAFLEADRIFLYVGYGTEVATLPLVEELLRRGKRVAVPRCHPSQRVMDGVILEKAEDLRPGAYGILEPADGVVLPPEEMDLVLVPGLAFDRSGYRLGYGGGYYDRFLGQVTGKVIGLAFWDCLVETLPREDFDLPVDVIVTEKGIFSPL